jgi:hypothetical protein
VITVGQYRMAPSEDVHRTTSSFDHKTVTLQGTATAVKETTSRRGNDYTTFKLQGPGRARAARQLRHRVLGALTRHAVRAAGEVAVRARAGGTGRLRLRQRLGRAS